MNKLHVFVATAVMAVSVYAINVLTQATPVYASSCSVTATGTQNSTGTEKSRFKFVGNNKVSAEFEVKGDANCKQEVTLASWQAPDADKGRPYSEQKLFKFVSGKFGVGKHTLTVELPNCFYQVDLVRGSNPTGIDGGPVYEEGRMMGSLHGGKTKCEPPKKDFIHPKCELLTLKKVGGRKVEVTITYKENDGKFNDATIDFGDGSAPVKTADVTDVAHTYAKDGKYTVKTTLHFTYKDKAYDVVDEDCTATVDFESPKELPKTGASSITGIFAAVTVVGAVAHRAIYGRRLTK